MSAKKYLSNLDVDDSFYDCDRGNNATYCYTEKQLLEFAEKYHKHKSQKTKCTMCNDTGSYEDDNGKFFIYCDKCGRWAN